MVNSLFGESDKEKFYPKVYWKLNNSDKTFTFANQEKRNSLRPDTIMITNRGKDNQKVFVLDSKYYRYGETKNPNYLPNWKKRLWDKITKAFQLKKSNKLHFLPTKITNQ